MDFDEELAFGGFEDAEELDLWGFSVFEEETDGFACYLRGRIEGV